MPTRAIRCLVMIAIALSLAPSAFGQADPIFYVRTTGSDADDGLTPETAFRTIQRAVNSCDGPGHTIYVGPGLYTEEINIGRAIGGGEQAQSGVMGSPNRIVGDFAGGKTGDAPGQVIIDGADADNFGVYLMQRNYWSLTGLTFQNQRQYGVFAWAGSGLDIDGCVFVSVPLYAVYAFNCANITINDNLFVRDENAGASIFLFAWQTAGETEYRITRNRMTMLGDLYLSTPFKDGQLPALVAGQNYMSRWKYGVVALSWGTARSTIIIENNICSDGYIGLYGFALNAFSTLRIANNTVTGCYYPIFAYSSSGAAVEMTNNIVDQSYFGPTVFPTGGTVSGLLVNNITQNLVAPVSTATGLIVDQDPLFANPMSGDFSLLAGSPAIDVGYNASAALLDIEGNLRPADGDGDGDLDFDLGAYEFGSSPHSGIRRVVQWRELTSEDPSLASVLEDLLPDDLPDLPVELEEPTTPQP